MQVGYANINLYERNTIIPLSFIKQEKISTEKNL